MVGVGPTEAIVLSWLLMLFGGSTALPVGVPMAPDAGLQGAAPPSAIVYFSHEGTTQPDPKSTNQIEQMLAEPEVQGFLGEVHRLVDEGLKRVPTSNEKEKTLAATLPVIGKTLFTRPSMLYVSDVKVPPAQPTGNAALIVAAGDQTAALTEALEEIEKLILMNVPPNQGVEKSEVGGAKLRKLPTPPQAPPVFWGVKGEYVFIAIGEKEAETVVERLNAKAAPPEWLTNLHTQLGIKRSSAMLYVNAKTVIETAEPLLKQFAKAPPPLDDVSKIIDLSGLRSLTHIAIGVGLDDSVAVSKFLIGHDGKPTGLLNVGHAKPLAGDDFKLIPRNADVAVVGRFNVEGSHSFLLDLFDKVDPAERKKFEAQLGEAEEQLGFSFKNDLLAGLGDTWTLYNSSEEGGLLGTGLCASISIRDQAKVEKVIDRLLRLLEAEIKKSRPDERSPFSVRKTEVDGKTISYIQVTAEVFPIAPAWCFVDDRLVIAMSPQMVKTSISRPKDEGSLADVPEVAEHLKTGDVTSLSYSDTTLLLRLLYSYAQYGVTIGASALEKEMGIKTDITKFPTLGVIRRHMRPSVSVVRQTKSGILFESYSTGPSIDAAIVPFVLGMGTAVVVPAVQQAREAAKDAATSNNMRNLALAMQLYANDKGRLPPRVVKSADGKPLYSWRVELLPYLDEKALYDQFRKDEPWDSDHNKTLLKLMPRVFADPNAGNRPGSSTTQYQIPTGKGTLYDADLAPKLGDANAFPDGTSATILFVNADAANAVPWSKPEDVEIKADQQLPLARNRQYQSNFAYADGSVRREYVYSIEPIRDALFPRAEEK